MTGGTQQFVEIRCAKCGRRWRLRGGRARQRIECPACGLSLPLPAGSTPSQSARSQRQEPARPVEQPALQIAAASASSHRRRLRIEAGATILLLMGGSAALVVLVYQASRIKRPVASLPEALEDASESPTDFFPGQAIEETQPLPAGGSGLENFQVADPDIHVTVLFSERVAEPVRPGVGFVRGQIRNDTERTIAALTVVCRVYPRFDRSPVVAESQPIRWLGPGMKARFDAEWTEQDPEQVEGHRVDPTSQVTFSDEHDAILQVREPLEIKADEGKWAGVILGELRNDPNRNGGRTISDVRIEVSLYDGDDRFLGAFEGSLIDTAALAPRYVAPFEARWHGVPESLIDAEKIEVRAAGIARPAHVSGQAPRS